MRICSKDGCGDPHNAKGFCARHYQAWKRATDPGHVAYQREWKKSPKAKRGQRAYHRDRYQSDPEFRERKKRQAAERRAKPGFQRKRRERYQSDPIHRRRVRARVYARKDAVGIAPRRRADMERRYERQNGLCGICSDPLPLDPMAAEVDHIIPVSRGGSGDESNLQLAHMACNRRKWAHLPGES